MEQKLALGYVQGQGFAPDDGMRTAVSVLLEPAALQPDTLASVLQSATPAAADDADVFLQYSVAESWALEEGIVKTGSFSIDSGFGLRVVSGEKTAFAYADDISAAASRQAPDYSMTGDSRGDALSQLSDQVNDLASKSGSLVANTRRRYREHESQIVSDIEEITEKNPIIRKLLASIL